MPVRIHRKQSMISDDCSIHSLESVTFSDEEAYREELDGTAKPRLAGQTVFSINSMRSLPELLFDACDSPDTILRQETEFCNEQSKEMERLVEWQDGIVEYYNDPISLLTRGEILDLGRLQVGVYSIGGHSGCAIQINRSCDGSPSCPDYIGMLVCNENEKELLVDPKLKETTNAIVLETNKVINITNTLALKMMDDNKLAVYDTTRAKFKMVIDNPPDLILPLDKSLVFTGSLEGNTFKTRIFNEELEFTLIHSKEIYQFVYTDPVSKTQRLYPFKVLELQLVSPTVAKLDFNYSYACNLRPGFVVYVHHFEKPIWAGVNPYYF
ncbi:hypothetical protein HK103_007634 [Boothiomyces macroporosus]|uniref:Uncharacterized protein n=1 Tax=Boothiomyces macroporosus TaxID=261099 RepID=A0AAD5UBQ7_9FUNG|nr:hypothetical protein HK103_007634 [Boothiomyces macroporosus]